jgi:hypothetical protein
MTAPIPAPGNKIVPTSATLDFPKLALASVVVGTTVYLVSEQSDAAGWIYVALLLLAIAYAQNAFANEISAMLSGK